MVTVRRPLVLLAALAAPAIAGDDGEKAPTKYEYLPVPAGAVARCGGPTRGHLYGVADVAVTDDAIVTAGDEGFIHFWDRKSLAHRSVLAMDTGSGWSPRLSADGTVLAWLGGSDLRVCRLKPLERPWNPTIASGRTEGRARSVAFDERGDYVWWIDSRGACSAIAPCFEVPAGAVFGSADRAQGEVIAGGRKQIAVADGAEVTVKIPSPTDMYGKQAFTPHAGNVTALWISNDAKLVATGSAKGEFGLWRIADRTVTPNPKSASEAVFAPVGAGGTAITSISLSADRRFLTVAEEKRIRIVDAKTGAVKATVTTDAKIQRCALSPDARTLVAGLQSDGAIAWDVKYGFSEVSKPRPIGEEPRSVDGLGLVTFDGTDALAAADNSGTIRVWTTAGKLVDTIAPAADGWKALALSRDGALLLRGDGKSARVERRPGGEVVWTATIAAALPSSFSGDGAHVAVSEGRGRLVVLDAATGKEIARTHGPGAWWGSPGTFPGCDASRPVEFVAQDGRVVIAAPAEKDASASGCSRDGAFAVTFVYEKGFFLYRNGELESVLGRGGDDWTGFVSAIEFSDDGARFAVGTSDGHVLVFDVAAKKRTARFFDPAPGSVTGIVFLPAGRIATADRNGTVVVWDPKLLPK